MQSHLGALRAAGIQPVAISVDTPEQSRELAGKAGLQYPLLSDPDAATIARYDLVHRGPETENRSISRPAEFLIDRNGTVRWRNLTETYRVRARPEQLLAAARTIQQ